MTTPTRRGSSREALSELFDRLSRVQAAAGSLRSEADMHSTAPALLADTLRGLEHDLRLAAKEARSVAERMATVSRGESETASGA